MTLDLKHTVQLLFLVAAFLAAAQLGSAAKAMAVYNNASIPINADFVCGIFCENNWDPVQPNTSVSCPSGSGTLEVYTHYWYRPCARLSIDAHGWVEFTKVSTTEIRVSVFHDDGSADESCSFDPTKKS